MSSSPPEVLFRPLADADAERVAEAMSEIERACGYRPSTSATEVREWFSRADLEAGSWATEDLDAFGWVEVHGGAAEYGVQLHPDRWSEDVALSLIARAEARVRELGLTAARALTLAPETRLRALLEQRGYRIVRRYHLMTMELRERPAEPRVPAGIRIEPFRAEDARAFHDALNEAFAEEWSWTPGDYDEWYERRVARADTSFYFVAWDGDQVAGILRGEPELRGGGFVGAVGVRKPWRGRGIGEALLRHAFRAWYDAGRRRVTLGVDTQNPTGATRLYERVGMHAELEDVLYEKELE